MIQLGAVIGCGSTAWPWRLATVTLPIPQSAFADSSLCTREVPCRDGPSAWAVVPLFAWANTTSLPAKPKPQVFLRLWGFYDRVRERRLAVRPPDPGLHPRPYRVMVYHTRSTKAEQPIQPGRVLPTQALGLSGHRTGSPLYLTPFPQRSHRRLRGFAPALASCSICRASPASWVSSCSLSPFLLKRALSASWEARGGAGTYFSSA